MWCDLTEMVPLVMILTSYYVNLLKLLSYLKYSCLHIMKKVHEQTVMETLILLVHGCRKP